MERRGLLKAGLGFGAWMVGERLSQAPDAEAAEGSPRFYHATMYGPSVVGWPLWLGWSGSRARGFCYAPTTVNAEEPVAFRVAGRVSGSRLEARLYAATDIGLLDPVGALTGKLTTRGGTGSFRVAGYGSGQFGAVGTTPDTHSMNRVAGSYNAVASGSNLEPLYNASLRLQSSGKYQLSHITLPGGGPPGIAVPTRMSGRYIISRDRDVWLFPTPAPIDPNGHCATNPLACLPVYRCPLGGDLRTVRIEHPLTGCVGSGFFHL